MTETSKPLRLYTHTHTHLFLTNSFFKGSPFHSGNGCNRGISLIALIITIIVIIILAAISIAGVSGVVERSRYAKFCGDLDAVQDAVSQAYGNKLVDQSLQNPTNRKSNEEIYEELTGGTLLDDCVEIVDGKNLGIDLPKYGDSKWYVDVSTGEVFLSPGFEYEDKIYANKTDIQNGGTEKPTDYTGYYADINGDGEIDGVIFADLAVGGSGDLELVDNNNGWGIFTIPTKPISSFKEYEISEEKYVGKFGEQLVITLAKTEENNGKKDRFYVMALENIDGYQHYWYYEACKVGQAGITDEKTILSTEFGAGKQNTKTMIEKWNASAYGAQKNDDEYKDMWGLVDTERKRLSDAGLGEWFVPSREEWAAFGEKLGITNDNFEAVYSLNGVYWASSVNGPRMGYTFAIRYGGISSDGGVNHYHVRLATTF